MYLTKHQRVNIITMFIMALALILLVAFCNKQADAATVIEGPIKARVLRIVDGDTVVVRAAPWPGIEAKTYIRILGIDTPEIRGKCDVEREAAIKARVALSRLLRGRLVELYDVKFGKFAGRVVARIQVGPTDIGRQMVFQGHARLYKGGKRMGWCP